MPRVKIKHSLPNNQTKLQLLRTLSENLIYATRIITSQDGFIVLTRSDEDVDQIFQSKTSEQLHENGFQPILPPELRAKRTVLVFSTDENIMKNKEEHIAEEFLAENPWMSSGIDNIYKIPRTKIMKITFKDTVAPKKATEIGILGFNMCIAPHTIKIEQYIPILTCLRCYALENHPTSKCPLPKETKICSECSSEEHYWRDCKSTHKKCINCLGNHRTLANSCPKRKKIKEEKIAHMKNKEASTYSSITAPNSNTNTNIPSTAFPNIEKDQATKMLACFLHAHLVNIASPGSYNDEINKVFKLNNLPQIVLPTNPPSQSILTKTKQQDPTSQPAIKPQPAKRKTPDSLDITQEDVTQTQTYTHTTSQPTQIPLSQPSPTPIPTSTERDMPQLEKIRGTELGLQLICRKSHGWPTGEMNLKQLKTGIENGTYKWRYTNAAYSEQEITHYLKNDEINLDHCWCSADDAQFDKLKNGQARDRAQPPPKQHRSSRHRHASK